MIDIWPMTSQVVDPGQGPDAWSELAPCANERWDNKVGGLARAVAQPKDEEQGAETAQTEQT